MSTTTKKPRSSSKVAASERTGMGAMPYDGGCAFRVWAPHADKVAVAGTFNDWAEDEHPLTSEDNGFWSADVADVKLGEQYKFFITSGDTQFWRIDPYARHVTNSVGEGVVPDLSFDWGDDSFSAPSWNELVIYELHIGTFNDDSDDVPGTFHSAIAKLSHLRDIGINAVEVMPVAEFPGGFSWGYNPSHPFAVESDYGAAQGFKEFIKAAHEHGIAVILDVVYNHFGPSDLDLWQFDGWTENDGGGIYFYNDWRAQTPWGATRPDYGRGEVRQYVRDNIMMWLEEFRVDGFRWDGTAFIRNAEGIGGDPGKDLTEGWSLMQWVNEEINSKQPWKINIAEDLQNNEWVTRDVGEEGAGFDAQWDANFVHPIREALIEREDQNRNIETVAAAIGNRYNIDSFERVIYTESHDEVANGKARLPEEIWSGDAGSWFSRKRSTLGAAIVFTAPGIPMIFQGQEFLEDRWFDDTHPLDWGKVDHHSGILALYSELIKLRRNWYDTTRGLKGQETQVFHVNPETGIIAFHRWDQGGPQDSVVVVLNMFNQTHDEYRIGFPAEGMWHVRFNSDWEGYGEDFSNHFSYDTAAEAEGMDDLPASANIAIGPYSAIILSQGDEQQPDEGEPEQQAEMVQPGKQAAAKKPAVPDVATKQPERDPTAGPRVSSTVANASKQMGKAVKESAKRLLGRKQK